MIFLVNASEAHSRATPKGNSATDVPSEHRLREGQPTRDEGCHPRVADWTIAVPAGTSTGLDRFEDPLAWKVDCEAHGERTTEAEPPLMSSRSHRPHPVVPSCDTRWRQAAAAALLAAPTAAHSDRPTCVTQPTHGAIVRPAG